MATAGSFLSEDQFLCSICLDVFTQPVSIPCGHNFCNACIHRHWENQEQCQCPLCNEKFKKGLKLRVNIGFREVVENFKKHHVSADKNSLAKPDQVPCDCCLGKKFKATKTCLVCLTSYCEIHLEPHLRVAALKRHKLTEPVHNLEDHICKIHNRMFEFSRTDQSYACVQCREHSSHDTMPLEEAVVDKRAQVWKKKEKVQETQHRHRKKGQKPKESTQTERKGEDEAMSTVLNQMQDSHMWWIPDIFNGGSNVPGNTPPKGRFYCELMTQESTSGDLGVVREPMRGIRIFIYPNNGNWVVRVGTVPKGKAQHNIPSHCVLVKKAKEVMLIVNYDDGSVLCMDNNFTNLLFSLNGLHFNEMVYLFCRPEAEPSWTNRLQEKALNAWSHLPDTPFVLRCIGFFFVFVFFLCII